VNRNLHWYRQIAVHQRPKQLLIIEQILTA